MYVCQAANSPTVSSFNFHVLPFLSHPLCLSSLILQLTTLSLIQNPQTYCTSIRLHWNQCYRRRWSFQWCLYTQHPCHNYPAPTYTHQHLNKRAFLVYTLESLCTRWCRRSRFLLPTHYFPTMAMEQILGRKVLAASLSRIIIIAH